MVGRQVALHTIIVDVCKELGLVGSFPLGELTGEIFSSFEYTTSMYM